ncbi:MAG: hypothetical protein GM46_5630 [actinobacterium acAcidi]|nr:MAG: hypothetical protein GM46_5630 [actinobacterium acAcidi]
MGTPLSDVTFCVIDFETTGGSAEHDRITEIGAAKYLGGECIGTFQTLVNPGCAIPPFITILTGITEAMIMPAPRIESLLGTLTHFIGDSVIVFVMTAIPSPTKSSTLFRLLGDLFVTK